MYGYYAGDNEKNDYVQVDETGVNMEVEDIKLKKAPSVDFNHQVMKRRHTSQVDLEKAQREAQELLAEGDADQIMKDKLMFEQQSISLFRIYGHLCEPIDWLFIVLAIIGSIGSGVSMPIMSYLTSDVYSDVGNTSESRDSAYNIEAMKAVVKKTMNDQIKKQLIYGAISFVCNFMSVTFWSLVGNRCVYNLKRKYFTTILSQEQGWFDSNNAFEFSTKVQAQLEQVEQGIGDKVGMVLTMVSQCIIGFIFAFMASWKLTLVMLCVAPLIIFFSMFLMMAMRKGIMLARKTWETAGGIAEEMLYNIKTVASFANFEYELRRFYEKVEVVWQIDLVNTCKLGFSVGFIIFFLNLCIFLAFIYGRTLIKKDYNSNKGRDFTGGDVISAAFCTLMGIAGIGMIAPNIKTIQESCSAASDYFNLYDRKPAMDLTNSIERPPLSDIHGRIEFNGVNFYYPSDPNQRLILNGIDLVFEPGQKVALVGESGCGKSTTVNLIERLYDITGGQLLIDGIEINRYDIKYLRSLIGYVQQEPVLFNKSIRENLIFGREEYLNSIGNIDELIQTACDEAYATEFINNLPDGLDYVVGIKGGKLSGGQKQRIAIARAILARPKILILDEATSALDNKSEKEVQRALDNISQKSVTTVIIAHRLSTIKNADLIYAIKGGKVLEQGNHKQLLAKGGYYAGLVRSQLAQDEIETQNKIEEIERKKTSIKRRNTEEEVQFERKDKEISLSDQDVAVRPCLIISELCDYKRDLILACIGAVILGCLSPINGYIMAKAINALNSRYETVRYDDGLKYALIFLAFAFLQGIGNCLMLWKFLSCGLTLARIYRKKIMRKYLQFHLSYFDVPSNSPGSLLTKMSIDTMELNQLVNSILGTTIQCSCVLIVGLIIGCYFEYRLTLIDFCFVPFIVIANVIRRGMMQGSSKKGIKANVEAGGILSECVINTKTIFSFNFQPTAIKMYLDAIEFIRQQFFRDALISGFFIGLGSFCTFAANAAVYAAAKKFILNGSLDSEDMAIAMSVVTTCSQGISNGMGNLGNLRKASVAFKSIYSTLDTPSLIPPFKRDNEGKMTAMNIKGKIELKHVYFAYPTRPETVILKDVSLTIMPGQQVALVGYSGSGKSTVIQLLNRFYDIEEGKGEILIDDVNIKDYNLYELRKKVGLVSQEPSLFRVSVLENVRYGNLQATDEECINAAREANIMKFFTKDKMNEVIGDQKGGKEVGAKKDPVSGGEKQRLAIARAFVKNPTILLLDEATSALDKDSELEVQKSLDKLCTNRTCVSIAHRLSTIENCDQIFVLENGRLVEQGTHQELMELKRKYYTLHKYSDMG